MSSYEYHKSYMNLQPFIFHLDKIENNHSKTILPTEISETVNMKTVSPTYSNWHSNIEILYFTQGSGYVHCDGETTAVSAGDIFVVNSNQAHGFSAESLLMYYCLIPDEDFCLTNGIDSAAIYFSPLIRDEKLQNIFREFIRIFSSPDMYREAMLRCSLLSILIYIAKNHSTQAISSGVTSNITKGVQSAISYIKCHLTEKITVEQLSETVNISKYHFLRNFKKHTGYTPIVFINKLRCENAKKLMLSGAYPVSEVCEKCGFENMSYFAKVFKSYTGLTPSEYARTNSKQKEDVSHV